MADLSASFDPSLIDTTSDAASSALALAASTSDAASSAMAKASDVSSKVSARTDQSVKSSASPKFAHVDVYPASGYGVTVFDPVTPAEPTIKLRSYDGGGRLWVYEGGAAKIGFRFDGPSYINPLTERVFVLGGTDGVDTADKFTIIGTDRYAVTWHCRKNDALPFVFNLGKSRGTAAVPTIVQDDDKVGEINFVAFDGNDWACRCAEIWAEIDGTPGENDVPGKLSFGVTRDATAVPPATGDLVIDNTGQVVLNGNLSVAKHAYFPSEIDNGNSGSSDTIDWTAGNKQKSTLTGNCTYTFTEPSGACNLILKLIQDGTGGRTVTWPGDVYWPDGTAPTLSTGAGEIDIVSFYYDGSDFYGNISLNFSISD